MHPRPWPDSPARGVLAGMDTTADLGSTTCGVWTRRQALAVRTRGQVQASLRSGTWVELWPRTYADAGCTPDAVQRAVAAVLATGGAVGPVAAGARVGSYALGRTSARLHGLPLIDDDDPSTGAREHLLDEVGGWSGGGPWLHRLPDGDVRVLRRHRPRLGAGDLVRLDSGLWTTSLPRTLVDCAARLSLEALVCTVDHALHLHMIEPEDLVAVARRRAWCPGAPRLLAAAELADGRAESPAETLARLVLLPVLPGLVPQVRLLDAAGRPLARFDLGDERRRFAVEADGRRGHAGDAMLAKDQRRDRRTSASGWHTERVTWFELRREQFELRRRVLSAAERHARSR